MPKKPKKAALTSKGKKARAPRRKKTVAASAGLSVAEVAKAPAPAGALGEHITADGGVVLGAYADPIGGYPVVLAALPLERVQPTPFQRDRSEAHLKKLAKAMERVERYLDPIIAVRRDGAYWTPNGNHRLGAPCTSSACARSSPWCCPKKRSPIRSSRSTPRRRTTSRSARSR
jgi:ParB family chromosome partitioning protein